MSSQPTFIPVAEPLLAGNELKYVTECVASGWVSSLGKYVRDFEQQFATYCGTQYGVATFNGTVAIHLLAVTLGLGPGDEVIMPSLTYVASANGVRYTGATPVFVDSERDTWNIDPATVEAAITPRTKAIMAVHLYGHPANMAPLQDIATRHNLLLLEDAAEAHGAFYRGRPVGGLGDAAIFSFYGNKIITTGEGGMITTNDQKLADLCRNLRDHAFSSERHFWHKYMGFNYRMTNLQAAVGLAQTEQLDGFVQSRRQNAAMYNGLLKDIPGIVTPPEADHVKNVFWMYSILVKDEFGMTRDQLRAFLAREGIETRTFFIPMHLQPIYYNDFKGQRYPVAEMLCERGFYLPSASSLTPSQISYVVEVVKQAYQEANGG